jgi:1-acyl-sn-glycerol-3-phosphate acyltransferase
MSFLRSLLISTPLIVLSTVVMGTLSILTSFFDREGNTLHQLARLWGKLLLAASFIRVRSEGLEKLDPRGTLPVDRDSPRARLKAMTEASRRIAERGTCMLLFPEGGRSPHGLREFTEGAAYIAIKAGVPIVPMALIGMREKLPMGSIHIRTGRVTLRIGAPISTKGMTLADRVALTKRLYDEIAGMLAA